ncbi:MAG: cysteine desulfurase [Clostridia bacterium]|nr:cysteine desulfurase [Clostridia bacterium]
MIYLDNSATTHARAEVIETVNDAMQKFWINPSAAYAQALDVEKALDGARRTVLRSIGGAQAGTVVFTGGGTEGDNLSIIGAANARRAHFNHIITTAIEHPAVLRTVEFLERSGFDVTVLPVNEKGCVIPEQVAEAVREDTCIVSVMHVNNEVGSVNDIAAIAEAVKAKNPNTYVHVDAVQAYLRVPVELAKTKIDLYSASAHKVHGPKGVGFLFIRKGVKLDGVQLGGGQEMGLRSGTQNVPGILGFAKAVELWDPADNDRMRGLKEKLFAEISSRLDGVRRNGPSAEESAPHVLNVGFTGVRAETLLHALEDKDVLVATGSACSSKHRKVSFVLDQMGVPESHIGGSIRLSFGIFNTEDDIVPAAEAIASAVTLLRRFKAR